MTLKISKAFILVTLISLASCATQSTSIIVGGEYNEKKNETEYFVIPYGSTKIPGEWTKTNYNQISRQQFFTNKDSIILAIAFGTINKYEFNTDGNLKGFTFIKAFYEWDSKYFVETHGLKRQIIEEDSLYNYMIYKIFDEKEKNGFNTIFLIGEKNGRFSNFSINSTEKWTEEEKLRFLKMLYLPTEEK